MGYRAAILASALLLSSLGALVVHAQAPATLTVDVKQVKAPVRPTLYGLMTEEINYSYDGGLYAELIRNRTFRSDWTVVLNWFVVEKGAASAKLSVDERTGPSTALTTSAKLEVSKADGANRAGLLNEGYWGMAVRPNTRYAGSFCAKTDSSRVLPVRMALVADQSGQVLASTNVTIAGAEWKSYPFEMQSGSVAPGSENHLEMTIDRPATVWLQLVSLFPPTYHGRANGNRADLMEKLAAMRPSFLRFPGGNYLEGNRIEQTLHLEWNGIGAVRRSARIRTLKANTTWATNTITQPERIVPVKSTVSIEGGRLRHVMPGYSIQVVEVELK